MYLDPELAAVLPTLPDLHIADLPGARARMREFADRAPGPEHDDAVLTEEAVPGAGGAGGSGARGLAAA